MSAADSRFASTLDEARRAARAICRAAIANGWKRIVLVRELETTDGATYELIQGNLANLATMMTDVDVDRTSPALKSALERNGAVIAIIRGKSVELEAVLPD